MIELLFLSKEDVEATELDLQEVMDVDVLRGAARHVGGLSWPERRRSVKDGGEKWE